MPKIEVNEKLFFHLLGKKYDWDTFEKKLTFAKAELDEKPDMADPEDKRVIKIELNDTNRPDLWSTGGLARCLREHEGAARRDYSSFLSTREKTQDSGGRLVTVDPALKDIRPYLVAFVLTGKKLDEPELLDIIQTQEKLCWNFGRKRKSISMGVYRNSEIKWPVHQTAADPDKASFVALQDTEKRTLRQIVETHPKGKDFGWILKDCAKYPLLTDDSGEVLSMAPIINSDTLGQVQVGDDELLVELTGDDMENLMLAANIVACDFADLGFTVLPVKVHYEIDTPFGRDVTTPFYYQPTTKARLSAINKKLGANLTAEQVKDDLERMGSTVTVTGEGGETVYTVQPAPYRNDFLHEVDVIEDVMIGQGLDFFQPETPDDFTIGRLLPITTYSRKVKGIMTGMGYQEMIFNYLGSRRTYIDNMGVDGKNVIEIANPMSENYQFIRPSIIASLLEAESQSGNAVYPHKIYEVGKVAYIEPSENTGTRTIQSLGFVSASSGANFNEAASEMATLLYYLDHKYEVREADDPRFIPGRQAEVIVSGKVAGIFGELHPQVLENWQISVPCTAGELDLEFLMANEPKSADKGGHAHNTAPAAARTEAKSAPAKAAPAKDGLKEAAPKLAENQVEHYNKYIDLRVAKIVKVDRNPQGEKLYIEHLDDGSGTERIIQSGLVPYLTEEELLGQHIILVSNLAPRKMRGVESHGMLLAADYTEDGKEKVELITAPWAAPGTPVIPAGSDEATAASKPAKIDIDKLEKIVLSVKDFRFKLGDVDLTAGGKAITTSKAKDSAVE
ncbi:MAG: phenylalanine--tRNA ligase subunit beta [Treponema sp.]|nr:phenylalanine--tRNA ligase subunit beta [Treponema sp.]